MYTEFYIRHKAIMKGVYPLQIGELDIYLVGLKSGLMLWFCKTFPICSVTYFLIGRETVFFHCCVSRIISARHVWLRPRRLFYDMYAALDVRPPSRQDGGRGAPLRMSNAILYETSGTEEFHRPRNQQQCHPVVKAFILAFFMHCQIFARTYRNTLYKGRSCQERSFRVVL